MKTAGLLFLVWMACAAPALALPPAVDLSSGQTPVKNQGHRGNCFIHATVAAMEAAYKRAGYGDLDLSELFSDYMGQVFFLETVEMNGPWYTSTLRVPTATERETSIQSDHAMSVEAAEPCLRMGIPEELYMPYRPLPANLGKHTDKNDPFWDNQFTVSRFNLDPVNLPPFALTAPRYYRIHSLKWLPKEAAQDPAAIEAVLARGREVIWDFRLAGDYSGRVWTCNGPAGDAAPHRMLIIGYNRTDPENPYFLAKNSWGDVGVYDTNDCLTRIHYDYLQYGEWASYIEKVAAPRPWPELKFIGRWLLDAEDLGGILDIYHLPGMMQKDFAHNGFQDESGRLLPDRRLGTFYAKGDPMSAYRVNGTVRGRTLDLWIDFENPSARWDLLRGWKISLEMNPRLPHELAGRWVAPNGRRGTAAAKRNLEPLSPLQAPPAPPAPEVSAKDVPKAKPQKTAEPQAKKPSTPRANLSAILQKWEDLGGATGFLGAPQTDEQTCPDGRGRYIHFAGGSIYWTPETGAHVIYGYIHQKWSSLGWETCEFLGYPTTDETGTPDGIGRFNHFEKGGSIYWTPERGAFEIHGPIRDEWARQGWEAGPLGYPVSDVELAKDKDELFSRFQGGTIHWDLAQHVRTVLDKK